jgi:RHH-type proline utilization regulon transcriptional repressor/proline dehydrogenase/delta 1-pyrroline-5-carboxylate dehydrogenase
MGKSSVGPGIKAGGPNYVAPLMRFEAEEGETRRGGDREWKPSIESPPLPLSPSPTLSHAAFSHEHLESLQRALEEGAAGGQSNADAETCRVMSALRSYSEWADCEFRAVHDHFQLLGEDNFRRYLSVEPLRIRIHADDSLSDIFCRACAARAAGCRATVSVPIGLSGAAAAAVALLDQLTDSWGATIEFIDESDETLADAIRSGQVARIRYAAPGRVPTVVRQAAAEALQYVADRPVSTNGRVELLWYMREQSISHVYHRYGNLGERAGETRSEPL